LEVSIRGHERGELKNYFKGGERVPKRRGKARQKHRVKGEQVGDDGGEADQTLESTNHRGEPGPPSGLLCGRGGGRGLSFIG